MLEDKELGLKIAEDPEEAFWHKLEKETVERLKNLDREIIINREILSLAISKQNKKQEE